MRVYNSCDALCAVGAHVALRKSMGALVSKSLQPVCGELQGVCAGLTGTLKTIQVRAVCVSIAAEGPGRLSPHA